MRKDTLTTVRWAQPLLHLKCPRERVALRVFQRIRERTAMLRVYYAGVTAALITIVLAASTQAQQSAPPPFATTKVTDNVYIFRYGGHQSMFIVAPDGVIATDPIGERRPVAKAYLEEIQKVTK